MILFAADLGWLAAAWPGRRAAKDRARAKAVPRDVAPEISAHQAGQDADSAVTALYQTHYRSLVRLAALLVPDIPTAEQIVQDAFVAMHSAWRGRPDTDSALCYLHRSVISRARRAPRQHAVADEVAAGLAPDASGAGQQDDAELDRAALVSALRDLPARQREVLVLRYYADLSEAQVASALGISPGAVRAHTARALAALRARLGTSADLID